MIRGLTQFVFLSDTHIGSTVALSPNKFKLPEDNWFKPSHSQRIINQYWAKFWERRWALKIPTVVCFAGDLVDSNHHGTLQLWTPDETSMIDAAVEILSPIVTKAQKCFWIGGTPAHSGSMSRWDRTIMRELGVPTVGVNSVEFRNRVVISDVIIDVSHQGPNISRKIWTTENGVRSYGKNIMLKCLSVKKTPPHIIFRGHVHVKNIQEVSLGKYTTRVVVNPSWQWKTEFGYRVDGESDISDIGASYAIIKDGVIQELKFDAMEFDEVKDVVL